MQAASQKNWGGIRLYQPGMTDREKALALLGQFAQGSLSFPLVFRRRYVVGTLRRSLQESWAAGAVSQGVLVPASAYQSLPRFNKHEFLDGLPNNLREELVMQLETGRPTGEPGIRFRRYLSRYNYLRTNRNQSLPAINGISLQESTSGEPNPGGALITMKKPAFIRSPRSLDAASTAVIWLHRRSRSKTMSIKLVTASAAKKMTIALTLSLVVHLRPDAK
jgi:hypothetical protein